MMGSTAFELDYWLECADKARADGRRDPHARPVMLCVAKGYERLAQHTRQRAEHLAAIEKRKWR
jgi:hypothetical protein